MLPAGPGTGNTTGNRAAGFTAVMKLCPTRTEDIVYSGKQFLSCNFDNDYVQVIHRIFGTYTKQKGLIQSVRRGGVP